MKINYDLEEDQRHLKIALHMAIVFTDKAFDPTYHGVECREYVAELISIRQKLYEFLQEPDPNAEHIESVLKLIA